ncbi:MAG: hypothetical protein AAF514_01585 [Verrucomicrobiota bacterium]
MNALKKTLESFTNELKWMLSSITQDNYLYQMLEPLLTYGIGFGLLLWVIAWAGKEGKCATLGLLILIVSSVLIYPYQQQRRNAAPTPNYRAMWKDPANRAAWDEQTDRLSNAAVAFYILALSGLFSLIIRPGSGILGILLGIITFTFGVLCFFLGLWLSLHASLVHRPDIQKQAQVGQPPPLVAKVASVGPS